MLAAASALSSGTSHTTSESIIIVSHDSTAMGFMITGTSVRDLYPGAVRRIELSIENSQSRRISIQSVEARLVSASRPGCRPISSNLELRRYRGHLPITGPPRKRIRIGSIDVHMPNSVVDECQRAVFTIRFTGKAAWVDR